MRQILERQPDVVSVNAPPFRAIMAAARKHKRVAASQPGFLSLKSDLDGNSLEKKRKRVSKNKKKNWNKYSDIQDVEEFLDDVRLQERATGGLISEKSNESLFFVDTGEKDKETLPQTVVKKGKRSKPLRIDLILQPDSHIPAPKNVLAFQQPNAKKQRRMAEKAAKLAAMGVVPRREKLLQLRRAAAAAGVSVKEKPEANNNPERGYYDLWSAGTAPETADPFYLEQTKKKLVKRPTKLNEKPSVLPAIEVIAPGGSYNPDFFSHQDLLREAHEVEVKKLKAEEKLARQLAVNDDIATQESTLKEQVEGLIEEDEDEPEEPEGGTEDTVIGPTATQEKKTEKQRKKEKAEKIKELQRKAERQVIDKQQQLFQLRSIRANLKQEEQRTKTRQAQRKAKQVTEKSMPRRLGRLKFQEPDLDVQLSDELAGSLRSLKPEGSILKDRFKSLQKRNLIEPRERAKFKRKYKLKYTEKRAFREIQ